MTTPLLTTKLYVPPVRPEMVSRPCLIERLNAGLHRKLTLVSAPAGFGKTTLLSEWASQRVSESAGGRAVAWLSLDEGDNDPARFLAYSVAALETIEAGIGAGALSALQSPQPPPIEAVLTALINEVMAVSQDDREGHPYIIVLDDYHLITAQLVHDALTFLLDHQPPNLHLVVASRMDLPLPLARLRSRGQLTELRAADLRFTPNESAAFLNQVMGLNLSDADMATLEARTEGWIAGLQMAALSMRGRDDLSGFVATLTGSHRYILDYLTEEVLDQQTESIQSFLLETSILDRLSGPLCDAVLRISKPANQRTVDTLTYPLADSKAVLEYLESSNLFVAPLDDERCWYRYHHLFADLLRHHLRQTRASIIPELHRQASAWYGQNGFISKAIDHAIAAGDMGCAARLVEEHNRPTMMRGEVSTVMGWLELFPDEMIRSRPRLSIGCAWGLFLSGQMGAIEPRLRDAETALVGRTTSGSGAQVTGLLGEVATLRSFLLRMQGDPVLSIELAQQAIEQVPEDNLFVRGVLHTSLGGSFKDIGDVARASQSYAEAIPICQAAGNIVAAMLAIHHLVRLLVMQGQLEQAAEVCRQVLKSAGGSGVQGARRMPASGIVCVSLASVLYEWNELEAAEAYLCEGIELSKPGGYFQASVFGQIVLAQVLQALGETKDAADALQKATQSTCDIPPWWYRTELTACQVQLWLAQENLAAASRWAQESGLSPSAALRASAADELGFQDELEYITLARVLITQGRAQPDGTTLYEALRLIERLFQAAESTGRMGHVIELLVLQALTLEIQGDLNRALACLEHALELAEPQGYVRIFADEGEPMARLLWQAAERGIAPGYVSRLRAAFETDEQRSKGAGEKESAPAPLSTGSGQALPPCSPTLIEPLTSRELQVLQLLADGLTYGEIAGQICVGLNTVRTHIKNVYGKLSVHKRSQAIARARELNLL
ncbi:MAG: LuxR C-terminal-related transcriptional regulator [Chloroflexota bacterium]|nr:LuxR C-terminal-related transcriptional regulator [Chloroflexota bacterium]